MPELPEVETIVRGLKSHLLGAAFSEIRICGRRVCEGDPQEFCAGLKDRRVADIERVGKLIYFSLLSTNGRSSLIYLHVHLGMTGQLLFKKTTDPLLPHTHIILKIKDGPYEIRYRDIRRFGWMGLFSEPQTASLGPDAWVSSDEILFEALRRKKGLLKNTLLNQGVISGLGNIYVDEALYRSKIHPQEHLQDLTRVRIQRLVVSIKAALGESLQEGGTSFQNYVDIYGGRGGFKARLKVYGKEGHPCEHCGSKIKKTVVAGRGTHFCPRCQPRPRVSFNR